MSDLVIRPERIEDGRTLSWCLQLRRAGMPATEYITLARGLDEAAAREIIDAGEPFWLYGEPRGEQ